MVRTAEEWLDDAHARREGQSSNWRIQKSVPRACRAQFPSRTLRVPFRVRAMCPTGPCGILAALEHEPRSVTPARHRQRAGGHPHPRLHPGRGGPLRRPHPGGVRRRSHQDQQSVTRVTHDCRVAVRSAHGSRQPAARAPESRQANNAAGPPLGRRPGVLDGLIDSADVLMQNFALGMAERYGMDFPTVRAATDRISSTSR